MAEITSQKICISLLIFLVWITKGLYLELSGPAMIDLKLLFSTSYESVTRCVAGRGTGGFLGAILGGILVDKYERHLYLLIGVCSTMAAACNCYIPYASSINYVWFMYFIIGGSSGIINIAGTRIILKTWADQSTTVIQLLHSGFGVGALLAPLICSPFLAEVELISSSDKTNPSYKVIKESRVHIAFLVIGVFTLFVAMPFFVCHYTQNNKASEKTKSKLTSHRRTLKEMVNPATYAKGNFTYGLYMFIVLFIFYFNMVGGEKSFSTFIRTYSVDVYKFNKMDASYLNTIFWLSLTIGRFVGSIAAVFIPVKTLFTCQIIVHSISVFALYNFAATSASALWTVTAVEGFTVAPLYGTGVVYGNTQIDVTGVCLMVIVFASSIGDQLYLWTAGWLYDVYGPQSILKCVTIGMIGTVIALILFRIGDRPSKVTTDAPKSSPDTNCKTNICQSSVKML